MVLLDNINGVNKATFYSSMGIKVVFDFVRKQSLFAYKKYLARNYTVRGILSNFIKLNVKSPKVLVV